MVNCDEKRLALILAVQAEVDGMKAENNQRVVDGLANAYSSADFQSKAEEFRNIAYAPEDQL